MRYNDVSSVIEKYSITDFAIISVDLIPEFQIEINQNLPIELSYLKKTERKHPKLLYPQAKSIIVMIHQYWHSSDNYNERLKSVGNPYEFIKLKYSRTPSFSKEKPKIARYALVEEYHKKIKKISNEILNELKAKNADIEGKIFVDSSPVYEKKLAQACGLGFIGKNTLLISPLYGSYIFISGIMLNEEIDQTPNLKEIENMCGRCEACIKACPTKALSSQGIDPSKCISFWTTHTKSQPPQFIILASDFIFGCDICQEICPFNTKAIKGKSIFY